MQRARQQIKDEQIAVKIVTTLENYTSVSWSVSNLASIIGETTELTERGITWLQNKKYIWTSRGAFHLTDLGSEYVSGIKKNVTMDQQSNALKFKAEALTGMKEYRNPKTGKMCSKKSDIKRAALSTVSPTFETKTPEDLLIEHHSKLRGRDLLCDKLGLDPETVTKYLAAGRIRYCEACCGPGVFYKKGGGRWESVCVECRKKGKRRNRK